MLLKTGFATTKRNWRRVIRCFSLGNELFMHGCCTLLKLTFLFGQSMYEH